MDNSTRPTISIAMGLDAIFSATKNIEREKMAPAEKNILQEKNVLLEKTISHDNVNRNDVNHILLSQISASPYQARKSFSEAAINELASSIEQHGLLQPLIVRRIAENQYELLAGERRLRAMQLLNKQTAPAIVCDVNNETAIAFGLIENIQRQDLNPIEEAAAYERLLHEFQLSHDQLAEKMGKSRSHITNLLRLHRLPDAIKQYLIDDVISMGHARAILSLPLDRQTEIAQWIIQRGLSVRQTEEWVKRISDNTTNTLENKPFVMSAELKSDIAVWQKKLNEKYAAHIKINVNAEGRGRVILEVNSSDELSELMKMLM